MKLKKHKTDMGQRSTRQLVTVLIAVVMGILFGMTGALLLRNNNPTVLVWAADKNVRVPDGLVSYLERQHDSDCKDYKGTNSVTGVTLFAVYDSYQNSFAKMTYGCGENLTSQNGGYLVAYKKGAYWELTQPVDYFDALPDSEQNGITQSYPNCSAVSSLNIPATFEPLCLDENQKIIDR